MHAIPANRSTVVPTSPIRGWPGLGWTAGKRATAWVAIRRDEPRLTPGDRGCGTRIKLEIDLHENMRLIVVVGSLKRLLQTVVTDHVGKPCRGEVAARDRITAQQA
jgi:hypothetical protein